ncbi:MAG: T9SS type A sorting domain-containing protein [Bacteroidetes bacterium]|nr:T9SS type A sorting domain-containing protein [Bacteroidota bacterium]
MNHYFTRASLFIEKKMNACKSASFYLLVISLLLSFLTTGVLAQTTLISPVGDGGFESGSTLISNNWQSVQSATNQWNVGTVPGAGFLEGTNCAFISNDGGSSWAYTNSSVTASHIYRDVTIPAGESIIKLDFRWRALGETGSWDALMVYYTTPAVTPVAGQPSSTTGSSATWTGGSPTLLGAQLWNQGVNNQTFSANLPAALAGTTVRLVFTWKNDGSGGSNPPAAIDSISLISRVPTPGDAAPTSFNPTLVTQTGMTIEWTDASSNETAFRLYRSTDNISFSQVGSDIPSTTTAGTGTVYSQAQTGLLPGITYYYRIASVLDAESAYLTGNQATNAAGSITVTGNGNWSSTTPDAPWPGGVVPTATDDVTIGDGFTVTVDNTSATCNNLTIGQGTSGILTWVGGAVAATLKVNGDLTVAANGTFNAGIGTGTKSLNIGGSTTGSTANGNLVVNGSFDMFTSATAFVTTTFWGSGNGTVSGSGTACNFHTITVNKGSGINSVLEVTRVITVSSPTASGNRLVITNGSFKLSSASAITPYFGSQTICTSTGRLWLNNAAALIQCVGTGTATGAGSPTVTGTLQIDAGTFGYGSGNNTLTFSSGTGILNMTGGTLNMYGPVSFASNVGTQMNMSGGNFNVDVQAANVTTTAAFTIGASTTVNWSNGTITIVDPHATAARTSWTASSGGTKNITGGTLRIGDPASTTTGGTFANNAGFGITSSMLLYNLEINNRTDASTSRMARLIGQVNVVNLIIQPNAYLFTGSATTGQTLLITGDLTNDGILAGTEIGGTQAVGTVQFTGTAPESVTGSGTFVNNGSLSIANTGSAVNFTQTNSYNTNRVNMFSGDVSGAGLITIGLGGTTSNVIQIGNGGGDAGNFDAAPAFNIGSGGLSVNYLQETSARTTGNEIPPSRTIANTTINNTNGITLSGGALTITGTLTLTAGNLTTSATDLPIITNTATGAIASASSTSYVAGPIARELPANLISGSTYILPVGKSGYNPFELVNPTTNASGTVRVQAEVFDANSGGTPGTLMSSVSTSRYWAADITAGSGNFTNSLLRLNDTRGSQDGIANSATLTGAYDHVGGAASTLNAGSITTTAPEVTGISGFYLMGNLAAATLSNLAITPSGNQCTNVARTVTVTATPGGAAVTGVTLNYQVNGGTIQNVNMTNTSGDDWSGVIPTVSPANATVTWSVTATDANGLVASLNGTAYNDEPLFGIPATAVVSDATICVGSTTDLSATLSFNASGTIGTATTLTSATTQPTAFCNRWPSYRMQLLFTAAELQAAGLSAGNITSMSFTITTLGDAASNNNFVVKVGNSALSVLSGDFVSNAGFTTVYPAATYTHAVGTNVIPFSTPFVWDGNSNIIVEVQHDGADNINNAQTYYTATAGTMVAYTSTNASNAASFSTQRLNVTFEEAVTPEVTAVSWSDGTDEVGTTNPLTVSPLVNTTYTATLTALGCNVTTNSVAVTVNPLPPVPGANNSTQCGTAVPAAFVTTGGGGGGFTWYDMQTGGTVLQSGGATYTTAISTTTHFWVSESDGTCESPRVEVVATVNAPDPVNATSDGPVCSNSTLNLTATVTDGTNGNSYAYTWTASPATGSGIPSSVNGGTGSFGSPANTMITPTLPGTYTYTVTAVDGSCTTTSDVVVTVKSLPAITTSIANPSTTCSGESSALSATSTTSAPGFATIGTATTLTSATTQPTAFCNRWPSYRMQLLYTAAELSSAGMFAGDITSIAFNITTLGDASFNDNFVVKIGTTTSTVLTAFESNAGYTTVFPAQTYTHVVGQNVINFSTPFNWDGTSNIIVEVQHDGANDINNAQTYYTATAGNTIAYTSTNASNTASLSTNRLNIIFGAQTGADITGSLNWTWNPGSLAGSSVSVSPTTTTEYTVTATDPVSSCSSTATVTVTVNPLPPAPSGVNGTDQCGTALTDASVSSNNTVDPQSPPYFNWYDAPVGGTLLQSGTSTTYTTPISTSTTFYVSEVSSNGCEGLRVEVSTIVSEPDLLTVNATQTTVCLGGSTDISSTYTPNFNSFATFDLTATGGSQSGVTGTVSLTPGGTGSDPYTITPTATGTYTYTITAFDPDKGCTSIGTVVVTVNPLPVITSAAASATTICEGASTDLLATTTDIGPGLANEIGTATTLTSATSQPTAFCNRWPSYRMQLLYTGAELQAAGLSAGNINSIAFTITTLGDAASNNNFTVKIGNTALAALTDFVSTASGFTTVFPAQTYTHAVGVNTINFSTPFVWDGSSNIIVEIQHDGADNINNSQTYYTATAGNTVAYTLTNASNSASLSTNRLNTIFGGQVAVNGPGSYSWVWNPGNLSGNAVSVSPSVTTTYTATATFNGCSIDSDPVTVTVNPLPSAPPTNDPVTRCGPGVVNLTATGSGGTLNWYDVPTAGTSLQTGGAYSPNVTGTTSFWVAETSAAGCEGPRSEVHVTVTTPPVLSITPSGSTTFCDGGSVVLDKAPGSDASYVNFAWSANPSSGSGLSSNSGSAVTVMPVSSGVYTITLTADDGVSGPTGCANTASVVVTMNPNPIISNATATPSTNCANGITVLTAQSIDGAPGSASVGSQTTTEFEGVYRYGYGTGDFRHQLLFSAAELTAAGIIPGNITSIAFKVTSAGSGSSNNYTIKMANTTATALTSTFQTASFTTCYIAPTYTAVSGTNLHTFSTPFTWDGTSNVLVDICYTVSSIGSTSTVAATTPAFIGNINLKGTSGACTASGGALTVTNRPLVTFGGTVGTDITSNYNWVWNPGNLSGFSVSVTPSSTTTYTATATDPVTGCTSTSSPVTVTITPVASAASATPSASVCIGTTVTLDAQPTGGAPFTFSWNDGSGVIGTTNPLDVTPTTTTSYTVTVTDACGNSTSSSVTVTVNPLPTVGVTPLNASICQPGATAVTLTATGATTYAWAPSGGLSATTGSSVDALPTESTTYTVTGTDDNGCTNTATASIVVNPNVTGASATATPGTICAGETINLSANANPIPGYTMNTISGVSFVNISSTGTSVGVLGDDTEHNITIPSFTYNGTAYTTARVGTNGLVVLGSTSGDISFSNGTLPSTANSAGNVFLAPWWDDLDVQTGANIFTQTVGNLFIIQFDNMAHNSFSTGSVTFQVQLNLTNGQINFVYQDVIFGDAGEDAGVSATVGLQYSSSEALQYSSGSASLSNGQSITFTPTAFDYLWSGPDGFSSTLQNPSIVDAGPAAAGVYSVTITTNAGCSASVVTTSVTVNERPTGVISGGAAYCEGSVLPTTLSIAVTGSGPWSGTLSDGTVFSGSSSPITVEVTPTPEQTTVYTIATLSDVLCNAIAADLTGSATVTVNPLAANPTATVTQPTCAVGTGTITVTAPIGDGTTYSLDNGPFQSSTVFAGVAPGDHTLSVQTASGCFSPATTVVTVNPQPFTPTAPVITGIVNVCPYIGTAEQITYHATSTGNGTSVFNWVIPTTNVTLVSGQGTPDLTVTFQNGFASQANKQLRVTVTNECGTSPLTVYYLLAQFPNTPNPISGPTDVCPLLGGPAQGTYTINKAPGAASYIWTAQSGTTTITHLYSGANDTAVTILFAPGFTTSNITVQAVNDCGVSGLRSITVVRTTPSAPSLIAGPTNVCANIGSTGTPATYSVTQTPGMTYNWTIPSGSTGLTGQGTNTIMFTYPDGFSSGSISVTATNGCGTGPSRNLSVTKLNPATPSVIDVIQTHFCGEEGGRKYTYSLASMPANATNIVWTIPAGATYVNISQISIEVTYGDGAVNGVVTAQATSNCGASSIRSTEVKLPACPVPGFAAIDNGIGSNVAEKDKLLPLPTGSALEVKIFPNPSVSDFTVQVLTSSSEKIQVRILDMQGRVVKHFSTRPHELVVVGNELKAGAYLVEVRQGIELKTTKVVRF